VLDEVADRADAWYARIWRSCSDDEKLVALGNRRRGVREYKSAPHGEAALWLAGSRSKDPSFRLLNQTFPPFRAVRRPASTTSVRSKARAIPSPWDRFRAPFLALLVVASPVLFVLTQQELFTATITRRSRPVLAGCPCWSASRLVAGWEARRVGASENLTGRLDARSMLLFL
jgi:hypothetical protein